MPSRTEVSNPEIAVVTTGGTIGSVLSKSTRGVDTDSNPIAERISDHCNELGVELEIRPAMNMLSENMEPENWAEIGESIQECMESGYENIIVTHGTDTMVYSANAIRNSIEQIPSRVIFTGSLYGPDVTDSDVEIALRSSLEASVEPSLEHGVYIDFRTPETDDKALLHRAVDTKPMDMDEMGFRSLFDAVVGEYSWGEGWEWLDNSSPTHNSEYSGLGGLPDRNEYSKVLGDVQLTKAVPGQILQKSETDDAIPEVLIVDLYHSGTASLSTHAESLREFIRENHDSTDILLVGMSSKVVSPPYESTAKLVKEGAQLVTDVQPHVVYTAMYVGLANGLNVDEILRNIPGDKSQPN